MVTWNAGNAEAKEKTWDMVFKNGRGANSED
jgi:hypothetical protein